MPSVKCPACGERVKMREDGKRLRCRECGKAFDPPDEDDEGEEEREVEERPRTRSKRKEPAKKSSGTKIAAIVVGSVLGLALVALVVIVIVRKGKDGGDAPIDSAKVTQENFNRVKPGMDQAEVESILGGSRSSSENDMRDAFRKGRGEIEAAMETGFSRFGEGTEWRRWDGKDFQIWVAFGKTKEGKRAAFSTALEKTGGGYKSHPGFFTMVAGDFGDDLDQLNADRKKEDAIRNDPKWVRGAKARELLTGDWRKADFDGYVFDGNGKLASYSMFHSSTDGKETTYRILDDNHVELLPPQWHPDLKSVPQKYEFRVNQDELVLLRVNQSSLSAVVGPYYRLTADAGRPGYTNLIAPLVAQLKSTDQIKQFQAFGNVRRLGKRAKLILPTLIELVRGQNEDASSEASGVIAGLREDGAPAIPALLDQLKQPNTKRGRSAVFALGFIGPPAKEALPTMRTILANSKEFSEYPLRDALTDAIARIEGKKK